MAEKDYKNILIENQGSKPRKILLIHKLMTKSGKNIRADITVNESWYTKLGEKKINAFGKDRIVRDIPANGKSVFDIVIEPKQKIPRGTYMLYSYLYNVSDFYELMEQYEPFIITQTIQYSPAKAKINKKHLVKDLTDLHKKFHIFEEALSQLPKEERYQYGQHAEEMYVNEMLKNLNYLNSLLKGRKAFGLHELEEVWEILSKLYRNEIDDAMKQKVDPDMNLNLQQLYESFSAHWQWLSQIIQNFDQFQRQLIDDLSHNIPFLIDDGKINIYKVKALKPEEVNKIRDILINRKIGSFGLIIIQFIWLANRIAITYESTQQTQQAPPRKAA